MSENAKPSDPVEAAKALLFLDDEKAIKPPVSQSARGVIEELVGEVERLRLVLARKDLKLDAAGDALSDVLGVVLALKDLKLDAAGDALSDVLDRVDQPALRAARDAIRAAIDRGADGLPLFWDVLRKFDHDAAMTPEQFRAQYEQQWPAPPCRIPDDAPKPWLVAGADHRALGHVLKADYAAAPNAGRSYALPNGEIIRVTHPGGLDGLSDGTLFVLDLDGPLGGLLAEIVDRAYQRRFSVRALPTRRQEA